MNETQDDGHMAELTDRDELWKHLVFDHGASMSMTKHGDPFAMHAAAHGAYGFTSADHDHSDDD